MAREDNGKRTNHRRRTRRALLEAALRLCARGQKPTLDQVAEEALVSRATAYRYFANIDALLTEASLHMVFPDAEQTFDPSDVDVVRRLEKADAAVAQMITSNEPSLRLMISTAVTQPLGNKDLPVRQNRRLPLIEAALAPARHQFSPEVYRRLTAALGLVIGSEAMLAFKDVLGLDEREAADVRRWMIGALVREARSS
ncbi:MAG TPA: helix-turn-helix domain-containing protein [Sphingomicrobium sp.]|nr:helix-turn-helix domain-containing protein [Sphingomicrobium sp.]